MNVAPTGSKPRSRPPRPAPPPSAGDDSALSAERPFPGLRPFGFADRAFFFGRERQTFALYRLVENGRFIAVVGSSGSGKSSLVLAGLKGLLAEESADPGGPSWVCLDMRPGASPLARLAKTLARLAEKDSPDEAARRREAIEYRLRQSSFSFESALEEAGGLGGRTLLLIVDQFEELFRFGLAGLGLRRGGDRAEPERATKPPSSCRSCSTPTAGASKDVRVLITMRSDFIGDCAYFHGLPEAVSATQYLVPNLTRSQLEDVIRKPIEKAGATIEPELVERLLNDCGDELDQLPVLAALPDASVGSGRRRERRKDRGASHGRPTTTSGAWRSRCRVTLTKSCANAPARNWPSSRLSGRCPKSTERAVPFAARCGSTSSLPRRESPRRTCAPCSTSSARRPARSLCRRRRSRRSSPRTNASTSATRRCCAAGRNWRARARRSRPRRVGRREGWLAKEQTDGQRYRTLVSLLEGGASGEMATLNDPERVKRWWDSLPRTAAWADRYGGKFEDVKKLIDDNITAKQQQREAERRVQRSRRIGWATAAALSAMAVVLFGWKEYDSNKRQQEASSLGEMTATKKMLDQFLDAYHQGNLTEAASKSLEPFVDNSANKVRDFLNPPEAGKLWVETLNVKAALSTNSDTPDYAQKLAQQAKVAARRLAKLYPKDPEVLQLQFDSLMQAGDAFMGEPYTNSNIDLSFGEYNDALAAAKQLKSFAAPEVAMHNIVKTHLRLGDTYRERRPEASEDALREYGEALIKDNSNNNVLIRDQAAANFAIGKVLVDLGSWDEAYSWLNEAKRIQEELVKKNGEDKSLKWELADTHMKLGELRAKKIAPNDASEQSKKDASEQYKKGVRLREEFVQAQVSLSYLRQLAEDYDRVIDALEGLKVVEDDARDFRRNQYSNLKELMKRDSANDEWVARFGRSAKRRGDLAKLLEYRVKMYHEALVAWTGLAKTPKGLQLLRDFYDDHIQIADAFAEVKDWTQAQTAYGAALAIASLHLADDTQTAYGAALGLAGLHSADDASNAEWRAKVDRAEKGAADAARALESPPPTATSQ